MARARAELQAAPVGDDADESELDAQADDAQHDEDTALEVTSEDDGDDTDDAEDAQLDGADDESDDDGDDDDGASAQDQEETADSEGDEAQAESDDEPGKKKGRRSGTLKRVLAENEALQKRIDDLVAGLESSKDAQKQAIIEELQAQQAENDRLRVAADAAEAEAADVDRAVTEFIGTDQHVAELIERVEAGNPLAAGELKDLRGRRNLLGKLMAYAKSVSARETSKVYRQSTASLEGLDPAVLDRGNIPEVLEHVNAAGFTRGQAEGKAEIERLTGVIAEKDQELGELKDKLTQAKRVSSKGKREVNVGGGSSVKPRGEDADLDELFDQSTGRLKTGSIFNADGTLKSPSKLKVFGG